MKGCLTQKQLHAICLLGAGAAARLVTLPPIPHSPSPRGKGSGNGGGGSIEGVPPLPLLSPAL